MGSFNCAQGFEIYGAMSILCASGRWKQDMPICISNAKFVDLKKGDIL